MRAIAMVLATLVLLVCAGPGSARTAGTCDPETSSAGSVSADGRPRGEDECRLQRAPDLLLRIRDIDDIHAPDGDAPDADGTKSAAFRPRRSEGISGLSPSTTYHYQVVISDGETGGDVSFTTNTITPITAAATNVTSSSATLNGSVQTPDETYHFDYGTTSGYGTSTSPQTSALTTAGNNLPSRSAALAGVTYHFRIVSTNGQGNDLTFTTQSAGDGTGGTGDGGGGGSGGADRRRQPLRRPPNRRRLRPLLLRAAAAVSRD